MMKRILFLADINSPHTQKWVSGIAAKGFTAGIFSFAPARTDWFKSAGINFVNEDQFDISSIVNKSRWSKLFYPANIGLLKKCMEKFSPDILHAHYATSYGQLGALTRFHPFVISAWGSDVLDFPKKSFLHRGILRRNFYAADKILSPSIALSKEISRHTDKPVEIIPFGIELDKFKRTDDKAKDRFVIGIIKSLEPYYGIDNIIRSFKLISQKYQSMNLRLMIVGDGSQREKLNRITNELNLTGKVIFTGRISQDQVPAMHNQIDIFVNPSYRESLGVSVLESSACEVPVIVSNVGGLPEVVKDGETGIILNQISPWHIAEAISIFIDNPDRIREYGKQGRRFVEDKFDWKKILVQISDIYARY